MRIGTAGYRNFDTPEEWTAHLQAKGYRAATCPLGPEAAHDNDQIARWREAAERAEIVISEVGAWCNPMSPDEQVRRDAIERCQNALLLAEKIGANCAVNIAGSRSHKWDGPDPLDYTDETLDLIVATTREIIDAVKPDKSRYTLEAMPWMFPDSPDSYRQLIEAVDRPGLAVHLDPVNMISSPQRYYRNADFIRECFEKLGPWIRNCHGKDIILRDRLTVHLDEVVPGQGFLDYEVFLTELEKLGPDACLIVEHLPDEATYDRATGYVMQKARELGIKF